MKAISTLIAVTALVTGAFVSTAAAAAPTEAILREKAVVISDTVTLGDLFINAGAHADAPVSRAPAPGERAAISSVHVANAARAAGLLWPNPQHYSHLIVNRDGTKVPDAIISDAVSTAIANIQNNPDTAISHYAVSFDRAPAAMFVAKGDTPEILVESLTFDARTGTFNAHLKTTAPGVKPQHLTGRATPTRSIPVPAGPVARDQVLSEDMLTFIDMDMSRIAPGMALEIADLVGMTPRNALRRGQPVRISDLRLPIAVQKDARVTITFQTPGMVLTATGRALENAPLNGLVRVINTRSHRTIQARVIGPDHVIIESGIPLEVAGRAIN